MYQNNHNPLAWIRGIEKGNVQIENGVWIGPFCVVDGEYDRVYLGKGVNVSSGAQVLTHDTVKRCVSEGLYNQIEHSPTTIEDYVFIGTNAVILRGCIIGHHSIIAAGTVLLQHSIIPPYSFVAGVPGVVKKKVDLNF